MLRTVASNICTNIVCACLLPGCWLVSQGLSTNCHWRVPIFSHAFREPGILPGVNALACN
jgi:hypothetical protein